MINSGRHDERVRSWGRTQHALAGLTDLHALDALHEQWAVTDEVLLALLQEHRSGDQIAGRTVLQFLLPGLIRISCRRTAWGGFESALPFAWIRISRFPIERCRKGVAGRILLDVLNDLTESGSRPSAPSVATVPVPAHDACALADSPGVDAYDSPIEAQVTDFSSATPLHRALELLLWARNEGVLSPAETMLLAESYIETDGSPQHNLELAARYGIKYTALRTRQSRAVRRLAAAVRADPEAAINAPRLLRVA